MPTILIDGAGTADKDSRQHEHQPCSSSATRSAAASSTIAASYNAEEDVPLVVEVGW